MHHHYVERVIYQSYDMDNFLVGLQNRILYGVAMVDYCDRTLVGCCENKQPFLEASSSGLMNSYCKGLAISYKTRELKYTLQISLPNSIDLLSLFYAIRMGLFAFQSQINPGWQNCLKGKQSESYTTGDTIPLHQIQELPLIKTVSIFN